MMFGTVTDGPFFTDGHIGTDIGTPSQAVPVVTWYLGEFLHSQNLFDVWLKTRVGDKSGLFYYYFFTSEYTCTWRPKKQKKSIHCLKKKIKEGYLLYRLKGSISEVAIKKLYSLSLRNLLQELME